MLTKSSEVYYEHLPNQTMLDNNPNPNPSASDPSSGNTVPAASVKRYAPPNQRNRGLNRRKSGDRTERTSSLHSTDGDKNFGSGLQSALSGDHSDAGSRFVYENFRPQLIALNGCCKSDASQLLNDRWNSALRCYNDPTVDLSERPLMYTGNAASAWVNFRLPHQLMSGSQTDFLAELQHAINNNK